MIDVELPASMEPTPAARPPGGCPECGAPLAHESACARCRACGYSPCG